MVSPNLQNQSSNSGKEPYRERITALIVAENRIENLKQLCYI